MLLDQHNKLFYFPIRDLWQILMNYGFADCLDFSRYYYDAAVVKKT